MTVAPATGPHVDRMRAIVADLLAVPPQDVTDEANFTVDLGADSLDVVEIFMAFEEQLGIEIDDEVSEACRTFGDAVQAVAVLLPGPAK